MQTNEAKRCAVFGANGYLGSHLVHALQRRGFSVATYDIQPEGLGAASYTQLDVTQPEAWRRFDPGVDYVFFFTGLTGTLQGFELSQKFMQVNEGGLLHLLESLRTSGSAAKVIFPSTRLVYRGSDALLDEDAQKETKTPYAVNKLACEGYLSAYHAAFDLPYAVFRICVPYGSLFGGAFSYGMIGFFLRQAQAGKNIVLFGDGAQRRTLTHAADICEHVLGVSLSPAVRSGVFNVGGEHFSVREVASAIAAKYGVSVECRPWPEQDLKLESGSTQFSDDRMQRACRYERAFSFMPWVESL